MGSRDERAARAAQRLLDDHTDTQAAADLLADIAAREERRRRVRANILRAGTALVAVGWATLTLTGIVRHWPGSLVPFATFLLFALVAIAVCVHGRWVRAPLFIRATFALAERGDLRALIPLVRLSFHTNTLGDRTAAREAFRLVTPLLARLQPNDRASETFLPPAERDALLRALRLRYPSNVGYHDGRLLFYGPRPTFASDVETDAYVALVETFGRIGNGDAVPVLATIAESAAETEREKRVVAAADDCLTRLCRRA